MIPDTLTKSLWIVAIAVTLVTPSVPLHVFAQAKPTAKPQINVRASPPTGFAPMRVIVTAEITGGPDDYEEYYCAKVEWDWNDDTRSEAGYDCDPYEKGKSQIRRRFTQEHTFRLPGNFDVAFRLKQGSKVVGAARVTVQVRDESPR